MKSGVTKGESFSPGVSAWRKGMAVVDGWGETGGIKDRTVNGEG